MGVTPSGRGNTGGGPAGDGYLIQLPSEISHPVHCDQDHYGPVPGNGAMTGNNGVKAVVGSGVSRTGGYLEGGLGGVTGGEREVGGRGGDGDRVIDKSIM